MIEKLVIVVWDGTPRTREERRGVLVGCRQALLDAGAERLTMCIADPEGHVPSPSPFWVPGPDPVAIVSAWVAELALDAALEAVLVAAGFRTASYHVEESVYRDYGDNAHSPPRSWPDGQRSPGVVTVSFLERPARLARGEWIRRWHDVMSPVSEEIQPRARYVRNLVIERRTATAPPWEGIVEEVWPTVDHVQDQMRFYGASNPIEMVWNSLRIAAAVMSFLTIWRVRALNMGEYLLATGWGDEE